MNELKFITDFHMKAALFLNKALINISSVAAGFILYTLSRIHGCWRSIIIRIALLFFVSAIGLLLWSFFETLELVKTFERGNKNEIDQHNRKVEKQNFTVFIFVILGLILTVISFM